MQTYLKTRPAWIQLLLFLGMAFGLFMVSVLIGMPVLSKITGLSVFQLQDSKNWDLTNPAMLTFVRGMILLQFLFLFTIPSLLFGYFSDPQPLRYLGLQAPSKAIYWLLGILLIVVAYPFVEYIGYLNQKLSLGESTNNWMKGMEEEAARQLKFMLQNHTPGELFKNLIFISLFAGIGEELFFRGILQRIFIRMTQNPWMGIVLTAAIFSGIHFQFYGFFPRFLLGILLGAIYWYSGSLWTAILAHFLYDASVIVYLYANPQMLNNPDATMIKGQDMQLLVGALLSLALTVVLLRQMKKRSVASYEEIYRDDVSLPTDQRNN
ncbi:CPBP family intramembrane glutamic endopeptidase [Flavisolibacter nicotianae]|uniref:CPBP family intramembrane glutamic endopeptidase n=1 Tax=Flavisolibacter nicotianae TaxID=2364882 RepID=UPI000EAC6033|nr:CPBP family intramembrane glutamic endopeptidase [Flavisolibacter nicotianae]